jgi:hypothetical protein
MKFTEKQLDVIFEEETKIKIELNGNLSSSDMSFRKELKKMNCVKSDRVMNTSLGVSDFKKLEKNDTLLIKEIIKKYKMSEIEKVLTPMEWLRFRVVLKEFKKNGKIKLVSIGGFNPVKFTKEHEKTFSYLLENAKKRKKK